MNKITSTQEINCRTIPSLPQGFANLKHDFDEPVVWNIEVFSNVDLLFQTEDQKKGIARQLGEAFRVFPMEHAMNANVLDFLLNRISEIPKFWKGKNIFFPRTRYIDRKNNHSISFLYWDGEEWRRGLRFFQNFYLGKDFILVKPQIKTLIL